MTHIATERLDQQHTRMAAIQSEREQGQQVSGFVAVSGDRMRSSFRFRSSVKGQNEVKKFQVFVAVSKDRMRSRSFRFCSGVKGQKVPSVAAVSRYRAGQARCSGKHTGKKLEMSPLFWLTWYGDRVTTAAGFPWGCWPALPTGMTPSYTTNRWTITTTKQMYRESQYRVW